MFGSKSEQEQRLEAEQRQRERGAEQTAEQTAAQKAARKSVTENANFLAELRRAGIDSKEAAWIEGELGPAVADANVVGNRSEQYEREIKWGNIAKAMQHVSERSPGKLCQDERDLRIARNLHKSPGNERAQTAYSQRERRLLTEAYETAVTNFQALSVEGRGGELVGETTVTAKREVREEHRSAKEKAGGLLD